MVNSEIVQIHSLGISSRGIMLLSVVLPSPLDSSLERLVSATGLTDVQVLDDALRLWAFARNVSLAPSGQTALATASRKRWASGCAEEEEDGGLQVAIVQSGGEAGGSRSPAAASHTPAAASPIEGVSPGWKELPEAVADTLFPLLNPNSDSWCARLVCRAWAGHVFAHLRELHVKYWRFAENGQEGPRGVELDKTVPRLKTLTVQQEWQDREDVVTPLCTEFLGSVTRLKHLRRLHLNFISILSASDLVVLKPVLHQLVSLRLSSRRDSPLPAEQLVSVLGPLKKLETLELGFDEPGDYCNHRDTVWLGSLGPNLKALRLGAARFSAEGFGALGALTSLTNLDLEDCRFDHDVGGWQALTTLSSLKTLGFHGPIWPPSMSVTRMTSLTQLEQLVITSMSAFPPGSDFFVAPDEAQVMFRDQDMEAIATNLTGLTMLTIRGYSLLSEETFLSLSRLTRLTHLQINDNYHTPAERVWPLSVVLSGVSKLTSLESFSYVGDYITGMCICAEDIRRMQPLLNLTTVELGGAMVEPGVLVALQALPALETLALYFPSQKIDSIENQITALAPLYQLRTLSLGDEFSLEGLARLHTVLPNLDGVDLPVDSHPEVQALQEVLKQFKAALPVLLKSMAIHDMFSSWHGSLLRYPSAQLILEAEETVKLCADVVKLRSQLSRCCTYKSQGVQLPEPLSLTSIRCSVPGDINF